MSKVWITGFIVWATGFLFSLTVASTGAITKPEAIALGVQCLGVGIMWGSIFERSVGDSNK